MGDRVLWSGLSCRRSRGFGLLNWLLLLALAAGVGVGAYYGFGQASESQRANGVVAQMQAIRAAMQALFGSTIKVPTGISTAVVARSNRVPGTSSPTTILNPYGNLVTVSGTGGAGYTVDLGGMSARACNMLLTALNGDREATGLQVASGDVTVGYSGAVPPLSPDKIATFCAADSPHVVAMMQNPGPTSVVFGGSASAPQTVPLTVGKLVVTRYDSVLDVPGASTVIVPCDSSPLHSCSDGMMSVYQAPAGESPTVISSTSAAPNGGTAVTLTNQGLTQLITATAPANPSYVPGCTVWVGCTVVQSTTSTASLSFAGTVQLSTTPGNVISGLSWNAALAPTAAQASQYDATMSTVQVMANDVSGRLVYSQTVTYINGVAQTTGFYADQAALNATPWWIYPPNASATLSATPPPGLTALTVTYSITNYAQNATNSATSPTTAWSGSPSITITTQPI